MLTHELIRDSRILVLTPDGPLTRQDFEQIGEEIDPFIAENGGLAGLMVRAESFPGWEDFGAMVTHLRFAKEHQRYIAKVAVVTDDRTLSWLPGLVKHFVAAEVRSFPDAERADAMAWLEAPEPADA